MILRGPYATHVGKIVQQDKGRVVIEVGSERHTVGEDNIVVK